MILPDLPFPAPFLLLPFFVVFAMYIIARFGWSKLAASYTASDEPHGEKMFLMGAHIGAAQYSNALWLWVSNRGFYLKPIILFRMFHPALFIPWHAITKIEENNIVGLRSYKLLIGSPHISTITVGKRAYEAMRRQGHLPEMADDEGN